jgi:hypothetical protein
MLSEALAMLVRIKDYSGWMAAVLGVGIRKR